MEEFKCYIFVIFYATTADVPSENTIGYLHRACDAMSNGVNDFFVVFISFSV